jgi:hypothetical protein
VLQGSEYQELCVLRDNQSRLEEVGRNENQLGVRRRYDLPVVKGAR